MSNSYYNHTTYPTPNSPGSSAALRAELQAVTNGFDLLPTLAGNGYKVAMVNSTGTALIASATLQSLTITGSSIDSTSIGATTAAAGSFTTLSATGDITLGDADTDTITQSASYVTGTQFKSAKVATNTLSLAAYDVDGAAYTNLVTLTASNTPTLALTSTGVGTINNMSIGATTASTGAFTTLSATGNITLGDADTDTITQAASYVTGTQLKSAKVATNTLNLAAYDVDGAAYTNLITLTASNTPTLALTSTGVGTINNMSIGATTASTGAFTTLSSTGNTTLGDASADTVTINGTVQPGVVISGTSTGDALRITQLGTGNALLVEDSTNPDSTPFVIDATGRLVVGSTAAINFPDIQGTQRIIPTQVLGNAYANSSSGIASFINSSNSGGALTLAQSRNTTTGSQTIVNSNDTVGVVQFAGSDGTNFIRAASIAAAIDGTPGLNDMPGRLVFSTTPDGSDTPVERARIITTGLSLATGNTYQINSVDVLSATTLGSTVVSSSLTSVGTIATGTWQGTVIGATYGGTGINNGARTLTIDTNAGTIAFPGASTTMTFPSTSQTLAGLGLAQTFTAAQTFQAANAVRSEAAATQDAIVLAGRAGGTGSFAATITTATLAASVTHTLPAITGTLATLANTSQTFTGSTSIVPATNSGTITIGAIPQTGTITVDRSQATHTLDIGVGPTLSGNTKTINFGTAGASGSTTNINIGSAVSGATTTTAVSGNFTVQGLTVGLGGGAATGNTAVGVLALDANTTGTYNTAVGHLALVSADGTNNTAVGSQSMRFLSTGSDNIAIGYASLYNGFTGNNNIAVGVTAMYNSTVTGSNNIAIGTNSGLNIDAGSFNTFVGTSSGQNVNTGSKNVIIGGYTGLAEPISQTGSNWIVLSDGDGNVRQSFDPSGNSQMGSGAMVVYCPTPSTITAAATLTNADIQAQIVNTTGAGIYTLNLPLGTTLETLVPWSGVNLGYDFYVINTNTATVTIAANTGVTTLGRMTILTAVSAQFRIRRTAANTFIVMRIN